MRRHRMNASSTILNDKHIYVFNGQNLKEDLKSIEKYNISMKFWEMIKVKTPLRVHNNFA